MNTAEIKKDLQKYKELQEKAVSDYFKAESNNAYSSELEDLKAIVDEIVIVVDSLENLINNIEFYKA